MGNDFPMPEWVKLIPADSIPVFCFAPETLDMDLVRTGEYLHNFFGERKVLVIRGVVDIYAIAEKSYREVAQQPLGTWPSHWPRPWDKQQEGNE